MEDGVGKLSVAFWALALGSLINKAGSFILPFLTLYLTRKGMTIGEASAALTLFGLGALLGSVSGGMLADHIGRRPTLAGSMLLAAASALALCYTRQMPQLLAVITAAGFASGAIGPAAAAAVADLVPADHRIRAFGILYWGSNVGAGISLAIGGVLAARSFSLLFTASAVASLIYCALVLSCVEETRRLTADEDAVGTRPLRDFRLLVMSLIFCVVSALFFQMFGALPLDMNSHGYSPRQYGLVASLNGLLIVLLGLKASAFIARVDPIISLCAGCLLFATGYLAAWLATSVPLYAVAVVMWTSGEMFLMTTGPAVVASLAPSAARGAYNGVFNAFWSLGSLLGPVTGGAVLGGFGGPALWLVCALISVSLACAIWLCRGSLSSGAANNPSFTAPR